MPTAEQYLERMRQEPTKEELERPDFRPFSEEERLARAGVLLFLIEKGAIALGTEVSMLPARVSGTSTPEECERCGKSVGFYVVMDREEQNKDFPWPLDRYNTFVKGCCGYKETREDYLNQRKRAIKAHLKDIEADRCPEDDEFDKLIDGIDGEEEEK